MTLHGTLTTDLTLDPTRDKAVAALTNLQITKNKRGKSHFYWRIEKVEGDTVTAVIHSSVQQPTLLGWLSKVGLRADRWEGQGEGKWVITMRVQS